MHLPFLPNSKHLSRPSIFHKYLNIFGSTYIYIHNIYICILVFARSLSRTGRIQIDLHAFFSFECKRLAPPSFAHHIGYTYFLFDEARLSQDTKWPTDRILAPVQVRLGIRGNIVPRSYCVNGIICPRGWHDCIAPITVTVRSPLEKFPIRFLSNRSFRPPPPPPPPLVPTPLSRCIVKIFRIE